MEARRGLIVEHIASGACMLLMKPCRIDRAAKHRARTFLMCGRLPSKARQFPRLPMLDYHMSREGGETNLVPGLHALQTPLW